MLTPVSVFLLRSNTNKNSISRGISRITSRSNCCLPGLPSSLVLQARARARARVAFS